MFSSPTKSDGSGSPRRPQTPTPLAPPSAAPDTRPKIDQGQARVDLGKAQEFVAIFTECLRYDTAESAEAARDKSDTTQASPSPSKKSNTSPMKFSPTKKGSPKEGKPVAAAVRELVGTPLAKFQQELGRTRPVVIDLDDHEIFWNAPDKEEILGKVHASETSKAEAETWASRLAKPESHFILEALQSARKLFCRVISHSLLELDIGGLPMLIRHVKTGAFVATPWFYVGKTRWYGEHEGSAATGNSAAFVLTIFPGLSNFIRTPRAKPTRDSYPCFCSACRL